MTDVNVNLIKNYALEIAAELVKVDLAKLHVKEIKEVAKESGIDVKALTKLANTYHKNSFFEDKEESESFFNLYEEVFPEEV